MTQRSWRGPRPGAGKGSESAHISPFFLFHWTLLHTFPPLLHLPSTFCSLPFNRGWLWVMELVLETCHGHSAAIPWSPQSVRRHVRGKTAVLSLHSQRPKSPKCETWKERHFEVETPSLNHLAFHPCFCSVFWRVAPRSRRSHLHCGLQSQLWARCRFL